MTDIGHNSAGTQLKSFIERIERVNEEITGLQDDRKKIFAEAKSSGFDPQIIRILVTLRAEDEKKRAEREAVLEAYKAEIGMV